MLVITGLQGYYQFHLLKANHPTFALLTVIVYLFTETLIIFFFVGTGVSIKEFTLQQKANPRFHQKSIAIKQKIYPPTLLNILLVMILFITGGAVDTGGLPGWAHGTLFLLVMGHFLYTLRIQHNCFRENTSLILEMVAPKDPACTT